MIKLISNSNVTGPKEKKTTSLIMIKNSRPSLVFLSKILDLISFKVDVEMLPPKENVTSITDKDAEKKHCDKNPS